MRNLTIKHAPKRTAHVSSRRRETSRFILDAHVFIFTFKSEIGISAFIYLFFPSVKIA